MCDNAMRLNESKFATPLVWFNKMAPGSLMWAFVSHGVRAHL